MANSKPTNELFDRNVKGNDALGSSIFVVLRGLDPFLQYALLSGMGSSFISYLGGNTLPNIPSSNFSALNLSTHRQILLGMSAAAAVKHIYWKLFTGQEKFGAKPAIIVSVFNSLFNSINSLLCIWAFSSPVSALSSPLSSPAVLLGSSMFVLGIAGEWISELQRTNFKKNPKNQGKLYSGGLFSLARNVNYGSYNFWRAGYALTGGNYLWGALTFSWFFSNFAREAIPEMEEYCQSKYGSQFTELKKKVPYRLIPYIY